MRDASPVTWIVQRPPPGDDSPSFALLTEACAALGLPVHGLDVTPGVEPPLPSLEGPSVVHGRATLLRAALAHPGHRRAVFLDTDTFRPSAYVAGWGARVASMPPT